MTPGQVLKYSCMDCARKDEECPHSPPPIPMQLPQVMAVKYEVYLEPDPLVRCNREVHVVLRDSRGPEAEWKWAVTQHSNVLNDEFEWEWEASPSNRTNDFIKRTRFPKETALNMAIEAFKRGMVRL